MPSGSLELHLHASAETNKESSCLGSCVEIDVVSGFIVRGFVTGTGYVAAIALADRDAVSTSPEVFMPSMSISARL